MVCLVLSGLQRGLKFVSPVAPVEKDRNAG